MISAYVMPHPPAAVEEVGYKKIYCGETYMICIVDDCLLEVLLWGQKQKK